MTGDDALAIARAAQSLCSSRGREIYARQSAYAAMMRVEAREARPYATPFLTNLLQFHCRAPFAILRSMARSIARCGDSRFPAYAQLAAVADAVYETGTANLSVLSTMLEEPYHYVRRPSVTQLFGAARSSAAVQLRVIFQTYSDNDSWTKGSDIVALMERRVMGVCDAFGRLLMMVERSKSGGYPDAEAERSMLRMMAVALERAPAHLVVAPVRLESSWGPRGGA